MVFGVPVTVSYKTTGWEEGPFFCPSQFYLLGFEQHQCTGEIIETDGNGYLLVSIVLGYDIVFWLNEAENLWQSDFHLHDGGTMTGDFSIDPSEVPDEINGKPIFPC